MVLAVSIVYLAVCLLIGMVPGRRTSDTAEGYVAGDRSLGPLVMYFITGATIFSAFAFLGAPGWAYSRGVAVLYILGYGALGFVPFYFLGPRAARVGKAYGFVTQAEMVARRFRSPGLAGIMTLVSFAAFVPYIALQMRGAGLILERITHGRVPEWAGAAIVYLVVLAYVLRSGVLGVGWTNTFQGLLMMVLAWVMGLYLPYRLYGGVGEMFGRIAAEKPELLRAPGLAGNGEPWPWSEYSSAVLVSIIGFSAWPHLFMKAFTARDERTIRRTVVLYPTFQVFLVPIILLGFAGALFEPAHDDANSILPHMLMNIELSPVLVGLFCAGALAASMSSGDAMVHATASILVRDGYKSALGKELDPYRERFWIRVLIVFVVLVAYVFAVLSDDSLVAMLLKYAYSPIAQFAPVLLATLYWRRATGPGVLAGLAGGSLVVALFLWRPELRPFAVHPGAYGLAANVVLLVLVSLATRAADEAEGERFLAIAEGRGDAPGARGSL